ncbi:MAG: hypothetical protein ABIR94_18125 [Rubrivivax sp.]
MGLVTLGNMKEPFSLGGLVSSADSTYLTDALPVLAFAPGPTSASWPITRCSTGP